VRAGKIICTGRGTHKPRTLATYALQPQGGWILGSKQPMTGGDPVTTYPGVEHVGFKCPTCGRDMRFQASTLDAFLVADLPRVHRDVSALGAIV
jgi:hypothetical protein